MSDVGPSTGPFKEENLTLRDHYDPDKHWIGESLPVPTQSEIAATVGSTASPGDSPFPARADHTHKLDVGYAPQSGDIKASIATSLTGWLQLNGATVLNAQTLYPGLWAVAPAAWKSGTSLLLPNMSGRVLEGGGTLGATGGAMTHTLVEANLASHDHTMAHTHTIDMGASSGFVSGGQSVSHTHTFSDTSSSTSAAGAHSHNITVRENPVSGSAGEIGLSNAGGTLSVKVTDTEAAHTHTVAVSGTTGGASVSHTHTIDHNHPAFTSGGSSAANTGLGGSGTAVNHEPAHLRVNYFIKT
jgi:microcystin-dependent protein